MPEMEGVLYNGALSPTFRLIIGKPNMYYVGTSRH
jgi:hypothetical protein